MSDLANLLSTLARLDRPGFLAIVLSPAARDAFTTGPSVKDDTVTASQLAGAPVHVKEDQVEPYRIFRDRRELRRYLHPDECPKCQGAGWVWYCELEAWEPSDGDDHMRMTCDLCRGSKLRCAQEVSESGPI